MHILSLDLGTKTGWAAHLPGREDFSGTWHLASAKELKAAKELDLNRREDCRPCILQNRLLEHEKAYGTPDLIIFEDVEFIKYQLQAQLWASLRTAVWTFNCVRKIRFECLNVSELKKVGSGVGNATKAQMSKSLTLRFPSKFIWKEQTKTKFVVTPEGRPVDDNEVDAYLLLQYAKEQFATLN